MPAQQHLHSTELRLLRAEHLKRRGDAAFAEGSKRDARAWYTAAIDGLPPSPSTPALRRALLANRCLVLLQTGRPAEALDDACQLQRCYPTFAKGHYRAGQALVAAERYAEAATAFACACALLPEDASLVARLDEAIGRMTRPQLAQQLLELALDAQRPLPLHALASTADGTRDKAHDDDGEMPRGSGHSSGALAGVSAPVPTHPRPEGAEEAHQAARERDEEEQQLAAPAGACVPPALAPAVLRELQEGCFLVVRDMEEGQSAPPLEAAMPRALYRRWLLDGATAQRAEAWLLLAQVLLRAYHHVPALTHAAAAVQLLRGGTASPDPPPSHQPRHQQQQQHQHQQADASNAEATDARAVAEAQASRLLDVLAWAYAKAGDALMASNPSGGVQAAGQQAGRPGSVAAPPLAQVARDVRAALRCYREAEALCPLSSAYRSRVRSACAALDTAAGGPVGAAASATTRHGALALAAMGLEGRQALLQAKDSGPYGLEVRLSFKVKPDQLAGAGGTGLPSGQHPSSSLPGPARKAVCAAVAVACDLPEQRVSIERVLLPPRAQQRALGGAAGADGVAVPAVPPGSCSLWLRVTLDRREGGGFRLEQVQCVAAQLLAALGEGQWDTGSGAASSLLDKQLEAALPPSLALDRTLTSVRIVQQDGALVVQQQQQVKPGAVVGGAAGAGAGGGGDLEVLPALPAGRLALPYLEYSLTSAAGRPLERSRKHPFGLSRALYSAADAPDRGTPVWAQLADGSCRWRQSAAEVRVIVLQVPRGTAARDIVVEITPARLLVALRRQRPGPAAPGAAGDGSQGAAAACAGPAGGGAAPALAPRVLVEGTLERQVVPERSSWSWGRGDGEEGLMVTLAKMNLELLEGRGGGPASSSWWPRLFTHHAPIAFDDYDKDYSDLPLELIEAHHRQAAALEQHEDTGAANEGSDDDGDEDRSGTGGLSSR